jgi:type VI secretion system protein ImpK
MKNQLIKIYHHNQLKRLSLGNYSARYGQSYLLQVASPLLDFACRFDNIKFSLDKATLQEILQSEIDHFCQQVQQHGYSAEQILIARSCMCALLDESIQHSKQSACANWYDYLQNYYANSSQEVGCFFLILERLLIQPKNHLDNLELMYLCLSFGYQGKYRQAEDGDRKIQQVRERLYYFIRQQRGEFTHALTNTLPKPPPIKSRKKSNHLVAAFVSSMLIIGTVYASLHYYLYTQRANLYQQIQETFHEQS